MTQKTSTSRRTFLLQNATLALASSIYPGSLFSGINEQSRFTDHGAASSVAQHRGIVATTDGQGRDVVLTWLFDHRGGYGLLMIDAETGKSEQFAMPFSPGDAPYASILSSKNKFYTLFKGYFVEFDPAKRAFTFHHKTHGAAMAMTEDDSGVIWSISYPNSGVVSYNPDTGAFTDYGFLNKENWPQYQRSIAVDDRGWVYFAVGYTSCQIVCFNPSTREVKKVFSEAQRKQGSSYVYRNVDGKVYAKQLEADSDKWLLLYEGNSSPAGNHTPNPKKFIADSQSLYHKNFKSGRVIQDLDLGNFKLTTSISGSSKTVDISYTSDGAIVMGVAVGPDRRICGGTAFPMRQFSFNPANNKWENLHAYGQFNTVESDETHLYVGGYPGGFLLRWDPSKPFQVTNKENPESNPAYLGAASPHVYRPFRIFIHPNKETVIYSGGPAYGHTGGGIAFWNKKTESMTVLTDRQVVPDQSVMSIVVPKKGFLLAGTTTAPGTGGEKKAKEAVMFLMDEQQHRIVWQETVIPGAQSYNDMIVLPNGQVAVIADAKHFFVFDPKKRTIVKRIDLDKAGLGRTVLEQGPRIFVPGRKKAIYVLLRKGIAQINLKNLEVEMVAESPQPIQAGGAFLDDVIYFVVQSHLWSYRLK